MRILAFDTCFDACSVCVATARAGALSERDAGPSERDAGLSESVSEIELFETGHAERLVPMIGEVMERAGVSFSDIDRIAVTTGPGTFTGTRIGIAAARALALSTGISLVGLSSLEVMGALAGAELANETSPGGEFAGCELLVAADARRGEVYAQLFDATGLVARSSPQVLAIADAARAGSGLLLVAGSGAEAVAAIATGEGRRAAARMPGLLPHAEVLALIAASRAPADAAVQPLYLRAPDAKPQEGKSIPRAPA
jgi:tRNA threonylcarbamoyladenosine biosynthesis protein TsaB